MEQRTQTRREQTPQREEPQITRQRPTEDDCSLIELLEEGVDEGSLGPAPLQPLREQRIQKRGQDRVLVEEEDQPRLGEAHTSVPSRITVEAQVLRDPTQEDSRDEGDLGSWGETAFGDWSAELVSTPQVNRFGPTRHIRTDRKLVDWTVSVSKKWFFIGDSNLSRLPHHSFPDLQIDSFPGANFRHLAAVLSKAIVQVVVEKVLISCGLNSRGQKFKETTLKQLQTLVRMAKRRFPYAEIWVPMVNFSAALPQVDQRNLSKLNAHLFSNMPYIVQLPADSFETEKDNVHWTKETAQAMFDHWSNTLNLKAP